MVNSPNSGTVHVVLETFFCRNLDMQRSCSPQDLWEGLGISRAFTPDLGKPRVEAARAASKLPSSDLLQLNKSFRFLFPWGSPSCLQISQHGTPSTINTGRILLLCFPWIKKEYIKELSPSSTLSYSAYGELFLALQTCLQDNDDTILKCLQFEILKKTMWQKCFCAGVLRLGVNPELSFSYLGNSGTQQTPPPWQNQAIIGNFSTNAVWKLL